MSYFVEINNYSSKTKMWEELIVNLDFVDFIGPPTPVVTDVHPDIKAILSVTNSDTQCWFTDITPQEVVKLPRCGYQ